MVVVHRAWDKGYGTRNVGQETWDKGRGTWRSGQTFIWKCKTSVRDGSTLVESTFVNYPLSHLELAEDGDRKGEEG